eukprot:4028114-Prymnesium_polylepis.1
MPRAEAILRGPPPVRGAPSGRGEAHRSHTLQLLCTCSLSWLHTVTRRCRTTRQYDAYPP